MKIKNVFPILLNKIYCVLLYFALNYKLSSPLLCTYDNLSNIQKNLHLCSSTPIYSLLLTAKILYIEVSCGYRFAVKRDTAVNRKVFDIFISKPPCGRNN
jgi:hypothetical protein